MNRNPTGHSFRPRYIPVNMQKQNLNHLLQQTATNTGNVRPGLPEYSRQSNIRMNPHIGNQQRSRFMLQKQKPNIQQGNMASSSHGIQRPPPLYSSHLRKTTPPRQYVLVRHPTVKMQPNNSPRLQGNVNTSGAPTGLTLGGQIQLGQTYQFDVKRSPQLSYPGSIILKQSPTLPRSQAQRIPLGANDKGKFIPFTQLMVPGQKREKSETSKSINILPGSKRAPPPTFHNQPKQMYFSLSPKYKASTSQGINLSQNIVQNKNITAVPDVKQQAVMVSSNFVPKMSKSEVNIMETDNTQAPSQFFLAENQDPFDWDEYLKATNSKAVPHSAFRHVEISLHNGFSPGMKLEVPKKSDPSTYWVATLISTCGQLLLLRYDGYGDDRKTDFWVDVTTADLHSIGWCAQNGKILQPPDAIRNMHEDWAEVLVRNLIGARTVPERLLTGPFKGKTVVEMIQPHMILEVQDSQHPQHVWMAEVLKNVGGRLLLRYKGLTEEDSRFDFWLFYLDVRLHQVGWGKDHHLTMKPPNSIRNKYARNEDWAYVLSMSLKGVTEQHLVPSCVFNDQVKLKRHELKVSWKLSVLDPVNPIRVRPATVVKVVDEFFFLAELDDFGQQSRSCAFLCHSGSSVFPIEWCRRYRIPMTPPDGYSATDFSWDSYLKRTCSQAAPETCFASMDENQEFVADMKLEACSPYDLNEICAASIVSVYGHVLRLKLHATIPGTRSKVQEPVKKFIECFVLASSHNIFPVGWCDSNNYPLSVPSSWRQKPLMSNAFSSSFPHKKVAVVQPEVQVRTPEESARVNNHSVHSVINPSSGSKFWCPVVCFNATCNCGIFINDHALSKVPKNVGPGNTVLVLKEVLSLLVGAAERPHKLLKDLEDFTVSCGNEPCIIKAKSEGKKYQATLHIVNTATKVPEYFQAITTFLKCCPNLLTLNHEVKDCPLLCRKERAPGRPPSMKTLTSNRGRKKKIIINRIKSGRASSVMSAPMLRTGLKSLKNRPANFRSLRHHRLAARLRNHGQLRDVGRIGSGVPPLDSDRFRRSVHALVRNERLDLHQKLKKRQHRMKLSKVNLETNPLHWSVEEVAKFMRSTDCPEFAEVFTQQQIDGQALLLLTLPVIQECLELKLGPALKVARHVERVKLAFYENFVNH